MCRMTVSPWARREGGRRRGEQPARRATVVGGRRRERPGPGLAGRCRLRRRSRSVPSNSRAARGSSAAGGGGTGGGPGARDHGGEGDGRPTVGKRPDVVGCASGFFVAMLVVRGRQAAVDDWWRRWPSSSGRWRRRQRRADRVLCLRFFYMGCHNIHSEV